MRKSIYMPLFVLIVTLALAQSQTNSPSSSTNQSSPPKQANPIGNDQPPSATTQTGAGQAASSSGDAQSQIQNAMKNDSRLSNDNIMVSASGNEIDLTGEVNSKEEKNAASKIAERYAGSLNIKNHLQVRGAKGWSDFASPGSKTPPSNSTLGSRTTATSHDTRAQVPESAVGGSAGAITAANDPPGASGKSPARSDIDSQTDQAESGSSARDLQSQIQTALKNEPTLVNDKVNVSVLQQEIDVSGSVATTREKLTAQRIVQSYAENRKVNDRVTVSGHKLGTNAAEKEGNAASPTEKSDPSSPPR